MLVNHVSVINSNDNCLYKNNTSIQNNSIGFKGQLGKKVVEKLASQEGTIPANELIKVLKNFGIGAIGLTSLSTLVDILAEFLTTLKSNSDTNNKLSQQVESDKQKISQLESQVKDYKDKEAKRDEEYTRRQNKFQKESDALKRRIAEFDLRSSRFYTDLQRRSNDLDARQEAINNMEQARSNDLDARQKAINNMEQAFYDNEKKRTNSLDERERVLDQREQKIIKQSYELTCKEKDMNEDYKTKAAALKQQEEKLSQLEHTVETRIREKITPVIRNEATKEAKQALAERVKAVEAREAAAAEKEATLSRVEQYIKEAEMSRILSDFRAIHNINDVSVKSYSSIGEQITVLTSILEYRTHYDLDSSDFMNILETMRNQDQEISGEMMKFVERVVGLSSDWSMDEIIYAISIVKDEFNNLDSSKASSFIGFLMLPKSNIELATDMMINTYKDIKLKRKLYSVTYKNSEIKLKERAYNEFNDLNSQLKVYKDHRHQLYISNRNRGGKMFVDTTNDGKRINKTIQDLETKIDTLVRENKID